MLAQTSPSQGQAMADGTDGQRRAGHHAQRRVRQGVDPLRMQIFGEQRLDEIMSVFKFSGSIANNHRLPPPNQHTGEDSYSSNLYSTFSHPPHACAHFIGSFRFFSERFFALLILLLRGTAKNEGILELKWVKSRPRRPISHWFAPPQKPDISAFAMHISNGPMDDGAL
jgi:hypothetical protein